MVYGGSIRPGSCEGYPQLDIVSAFQSYGKYLQDGKTEAAEQERRDVVRNSCPGAGACGGVGVAFLGGPTFVTLITPSISRCTPRTRWLPAQKPSA